ncbi:MAG TPA: hypothetical protein VGF13_09820 [Verrucomicrobiae bacterium]
MLRESGRQHLPVAPGQRRPFVLKRKPFEVYNTPNVLRPLEERTEDAWKLFKVRHGYVNNVKCDNADHADNEVVATEEFEALEGAEAYYVWLEITLDVSSDVYSVRFAHGELVAGVLTLDGGAPANWTNFPNRSTDPAMVFITLAKIDTDAFLSRKRAVVRQFVRDDIFITGVNSGGDGGWV